MNKNYIQITDNFPRKKPTLGLGDAVEYVAQPVATAIDKVMGTSLKTCGGCKDRKNSLNKLAPDILHPFKK